MYYIVWPILFVKRAQTYPSKVHKEEYVLQFEVSNCDNNVSFVPDEAQIFRICEN